MKNAVISKNFFMLILFILFPRFNITKLQQSSSHSVTRYFYFVIELPLFLIFKGLLTGFKQKKISFLHEI